MSTPAKLTEEDALAKVTPSTPYAKTIQNWIRTAFSNLRKAGVSSPTAHELEEEGEGRRKAKGAEYKKGKREGMAFIRTEFGEKRKREEEDVASEFVEKRKREEEEDVASDDEDVASDDEEAQGDESDAAVVPDEESEEDTSNLLALRPRTANTIAAANTTAAAADDHDVIPECEAIIEERRFVDVLVRHRSAADKGALLKTVESYHPLKIIIESPNDADACAILSLIEEHVGQSPMSQLIHDLTLANIARNERSKCVAQDA